jgi:tRNA A37 N6-isopentenylltransferase MiaA
LQIFSQGGQMHKRKNDVYQAMYIFCNKPRVQLQQDINARVDLMLLNG